MRQAIAFLAAIGIASVGCHRMILTKASCGSDFGSSAMALAIPDPSISWAFSHYLDCSHRAVWMSFVNPEANFKFYVGVGTPPVPRHQTLRADAIIIGPGLPQLSSEELASLPAQIRDDPVWASGTLGAILHRGPADQSTCNHLGAVMKDESSVRNGRCDFYEPYGKTNSWRILDADENVIPQAQATYYVAVWAQEDTSAKLGIAMGTWVENFITPFSISTPSCNRSILDWSEKLGDQETCFPVTACPVSTPIPNTVCTAMGSCGGSSCEDTLPSNPMCTFGNMCDCATVIKSTPCGTVMETAMGNVDINSVCGKTCNACGSDAYDPEMGCGGLDCPSAVKLWDTANMKMHGGMAVKFTCNAAVDFVRSMIPHHQGAVDMCKVLVEDLSCFEDGALSGLVHFCNHIKAEQDREIAGMTKWLEGKGISGVASCGTQHSQDCTTPAKDTIASNPLCTFGQMCDCATIIQQHACGTAITTNMGNVDVNSVCGGTCSLCSDGRRLKDHDMGGMHMKGQHEGMSMGCGDLTCSSSKKFMDANNMMMMAMSVEFSCDPSLDFVRGMIPHHAGAIAMCDIVVESSENLDPYLAELCANITGVQRAEIAFLSDWLLARGKNISTSCGDCHAPVQPEPPCEDMLASSSFCHVLGGDFNCRCEKITSQHTCNDVVEIKGFGKLNVSAECKRTCGLCPAERPPLFHFPCGMDHGKKDSGHNHENHVASNATDHTHNHGHQMPSNATEHNHNPGQHVASNTNGHGDNESHKGDTVAADAAVLRTFWAWSGAAAVGAVFA